VSAKKTFVVWKLPADLALAYIKILTRSAHLVDTKGRGGAKARRDLTEAVEEGRQASPRPRIRRAP
jgi:hypothetical protein